jgi:hypothetical protein
MEIRMKNSTYYFSHDYNANSDTKILFMRQQLGMEGYGIYWFLIEKLADAGGYLPLKIIPVLAMQMHTTEIKVKAVIESFELFEITDNQFFSIRLLMHLDIRNSYSEAGKKGAKLRWENGGANRGAIGEANAKERKGKEIKGKEKKEVNASLLNSNLFRQPKVPSLEEVQMNFISCGGNKEMAEAFFNKHSAVDWFMKGSPITNYKTLIPNFIKIYNENESKSKSNKTRQQTTNESIEYIQAKGAELYAKLYGSNNES